MSFIMKHQPKSNNLRKHKLIRVNNIKIKLNFKYTLQMVLKITLHFIHSFSLNNPKLNSKTSNEYHYHIFICIIYFSLLRSFSPLLFSDVLFYHFIQLQGTALNQSSFVISCNCVLCNTIRNLFLRSNFYSFEGKDKE